MDTRTTYNNVAVNYVSAIVAYYKQATIRGVCSKEHSPLWDKGGLERQNNWLLSLIRAELFSLLERRSQLFNSEAFAQKVRFSSLSVDNKRWKTLRVSL